LAKSEEGEGERMLLNVDDSDVSGSMDMEDKVNPADWVGALISPEKH
jgi:hypothetical protein